MQINGHMLPYAWNHTISYKRQRPGFEPMIYHIRGKQANHLHKWRGLVQYNIICVTLTILTGTSLHLLKYIYV
jgi:hypothetical protein